ncbi:MAG: sirohydrochlorin cobaltochelatase [Actinomycetia bacterium]|nr:sirohydrochlorin cobaltochelatase [Actinomycetes bacterium]
MKKIITIIAIVSLTVFAFIGCSTANQSSSVEPVIVLAAFGSSYETGEKNLSDNDKAMSERFPDTEIYWAFTAQGIIDGLKEAGKTTYFDREVPIKNLEEIYAQLIEEGKTNVMVQSLHSMVGAEFREVVGTSTKGLNIKYSYPLTFYPENIQNAVNALAGEFGDPSDTATILCAHGNEAHPENNSQLIEMDNYLRANFENAYLACVEGPPGFEGVAEDIAASGVTKIKFVPFMLTYGDHITNDVMGDEPDSWKTQLGLDASCADGMGANADIMEIYLKSIKHVLSQF